MGKLILAIGLCVGGTVFVVARFVILQFARSSALRLIDRVRKDPSYVHSVAVDLDIPISTRKNFSRSDFVVLKKYLANLQKAGNYHILHVADVNAEQFIVFTHVAYVDFAAGLSGHGKDVKKIEYLIFLVCLEEPSNLTIRSSIYHNTSEKFLKEGFIAAVFDGRKILEM